MITLKLKTELYPEEAIAAAVRAFAPLASVTTRAKGDCIVCEFDSCDLGEEETMLEFENYLIDLIATTTT